MSKGNSLNGKKETCGLRKDAFFFTACASVGCIILPQILLI